MIMLEAQGISKSFPGVKALDDVHFSVEQGEVLGLVGENGAGKSTLMKIMSGYYPHGSYEGVLKVRENQVRFAAPADAERVGLEMIYQEIHMHLDLTVGENIFLGKWPKDRLGLVSWKRIMDDAQCYLDMVGARFSPGDTMRSLSASRQQQVAIARALYRDPSVLILDEPTSVLTGKESDILFSILDYLNREKNLTVVLISHKLEEVFENTHRIVTLRDGRTVGSHRTEEVDKGTIIKEMVGREMKSFFFKKEVPFGKVLLDVSGISVPHPYIKEKMLLDRVSFSVRAGEILGVAGLVGAGRSELVNAVFGGLKRREGKVLVEGRPVASNNRSSSIGHGIGLIPEDRKKDGFVSILDIKGNITLAALEKISRAGMVNRRREWKESERLFRELQIKAPSLSTPAGKLSGGNQQKVVIAKWLMADSRILLLDEPTRGVDVGAKEEIYRLIGDFVDQGFAVVLISSELVELLALSDRVIVLRDGGITAELERKDFSSEAVMEHAV
jgi:D-xylose transport system ATP-binding protein